MEHFKIVLIIVVQWDGGQDKDRDKDMDIVADRKEDRWYEDDSAGRAEARGGQ